MNRDYFKWIIFLAVASVVVVSLFMWNESVSQQLTPAKEIIPRPFSPYNTYISAVGIVEASTGNIFIGTPVNRVVDKIEVKVGQKVKTGQVLFRLESRDLEADLASRCIDYENAQANLSKLESLPRQEDVTSSNAQLKSAETDYNLAKSQFERVDGLQTSGAMSKEEVARRRFSMEEAFARYQRAKADSDKTQAGAWKPDLDIARLQVKQSKALVQRVEADIDRTIIKAPTDATVLQIRIHEGEFPPSDSSRAPPMIIGNTDFMHLRVSINQFDASFFNPESPAVAYLQGNAEMVFPLKFVNLEPYFVTKQNLSNEITEKVDTKVLQAIYCFEEGENRVFVGQQMDVFIKTQFATTE